MKLAITAFALLLASASPARADGPKNRWVAAGLNWVLPGAGYAYNGDKPLYVTVPMIAGAIGLTYLEQVHEFDDGKRLLDHDRTAFAVMFGSVLVLNTALAIDAYREAGAINRRAGARERTAWHFGAAPTRSGFGAMLGRAF
jgi:hypothetical protein